MGDKEWTVFFTQAVPPQTRADAKQQRRERFHDPGVVETTLGTVTQPDGSIEHADQVVVGGKEQNNDDKLPDLLRYLTPEQAEVNAAVYQMQAAEARGKYPDWDQVFSDPDPPDVPDPVMWMVTRSGMIKNATDVAYHLATHRQELDALRQKSPKKQQQHVMELSCKLHDRPDEVGLDTAPYSRYSRVRNEQIRNRHTGNFIRKDR